LLPFLLSFSSVITKNASSFLPSLSLFSNILHSYIIKSYGRPLSKSGKEGEEKHRGKASWLELVEESGELGEECMEDKCELVEVEEKRTCMAS